MLSKEKFKGRNYTIDTIKEGENASFTVEITEEMQKNFLTLTGDNNPMHVDPLHAGAYGFDNVLVYGFLQASMFSKLCGVYLPGRNCLLQECNIKWVRPVYVNDILTVYGIVKEVDMRFKRITIKVYIKNQKEEKVCRGRLVCGVLDGIGK